MTTIAILGATGYTAYELIKILLRHPGAEIVALTSREETRRVDQVHLSLVGALELPLENLSPREISNKAECVFSCLPHTASALTIPQLLEHGTKVIDFSADYRLDSPNVFRKWYETDHPDAQRLGKVPYGLPELFRSQLVNAHLIANPGCYPTSAILPIAPLLKKGFVQPQGLIFDSKSGVSGAGRKPKLTTLYTECNESIAVYGLGTHRHTPEIDLILSKYSGEVAEVIFTPQLTPMDRGILTVAYADPTNPDTTAEEVRETLEEFYSNEPFVHIVPHLPATKDVARTNNVHIAVRKVRGKIVTVSVIDNLVKGASGAAVQNFNLMFGYPETAALIL